MSKIDKRVIDLLREGFPMPPDVPYESSMRFEDLAEIGMQARAHEAVNLNDKSIRAEMVLTVCENLMAGCALTVAERAWLIYVLNRLKDVPHKSRGRRLIQRDQRLEFLMHLIGFIEQDKRQSKNQKRGAVTERLHKAADHFCKSFDVIEKAYKSKEYRNLRKNLLERGFIDRALSALINS